MKPLLQKFKVYSSKHKQHVMNSRGVRCYHCLKFCRPQDIKEWVDKGLTALCPFCGIDAVVPDIAFDFYILDDELFREAQTYYFEVESETENCNEGA